MKSRILKFSLVIVLLCTFSGLQAIPVRAEATIESIYFTPQELEELRLLRTAPSHSTIWGNIESWAITHLADAPPATYSDVGTSEWAWTVFGYAARRHIETMSFMYAMTGNTTYADSAINWMVTISGYSEWRWDRYWSVAELLRGFALGYSVLRDYMSPTDKQTILNAMVLHTNTIQTIMNNLARGAPDARNRAFPNYYGTLAGCVGLAALAIGADDPIGAEALNDATVTIQGMLFDGGGQDGGWFEGPRYSMVLFGHVLPFLDALKRAGTDLLTGNSFLENHAYYYIYLSYNNYIMAVEDHEISHSYFIESPYDNNLDFMYMLAKEYDNGYFQRFADLHSDQSVIQSYIWKSPSLVSLPLDGLPTTRLFEGTGKGVGYAVFKSGWGDNDLNIIFKSGRSWGHAHPSQNGFTIYNNGVKVTGDPGYSTLSDEDDTWSHNCLLEDGNGQGQETGDYSSMPLGTRGIIEQVDVNDPYYRYVLGDASAVYTGWSGTSPGGRTYTVGTLDKWLRHIIFVENPNFLVIYDDVRAPEPSRFDWLLNGATLSVAGDTITVNNGALNTIVLEPDNFLSEITHYHRETSWYVHDYDYIKVRPPVEEATAKFLTVHYPGSPTLPTEKISIGNAIGAKVTDGDNLYLILFSADGNPVSEYIELGGYYQSADGNSYTFNGTQVLADFTTYQVMRLQRPRPPVLVLIGDKSINEGQLFQFTISASDPNDDPLSYSASNMPQGASFDPETRTFSWIPTSGQAGSYSNVHFEVSDGELIDLEDITITVNGPPVLESIGDKSVNEGELLEFGISATDPDNDPLIYSASNVPSGASFNLRTRVFSWTPNFGQAGIYTNVRFEVSDGKVTDSKDIIVTVHPADITPPEIDEIVASEIRPHRADISWTTNEPSTSQIEYWTSPSEITPLDETLVTHHVIRLMNLTAGTTYHYRALSRDEKGNLAVSPIHTFTTPIHVTQLVITCASVLILIAITVFLILVRRRRMVRRLGQT